jgi:hypothetical protein
MLEELNEKKNYERHFVAAREKRLGHARRLIL